MLTLNLLIAGGCLYRLMLAFQQSGYKRLSISDYNKSSYCFGLISMLFAFVSVSVDIILRDLIIFYTAGAIVMIIMVLQLYLIYSKPYKKPLKFTPRVIRLYIITLIIIGLYQLLYFTEFRCLIWMVYLLLPPIILLANLILYPFEQINNKKYIRNAEVKLNAFKGIKIGITGSFGKTTVKNFLREILSRKYNTLATPESFNTPLGISRTVQKLEENTEVFIAEMGARRKGDIKELCDIVKPSIGIVTGVNNQHSETFKSIDNTFRTKYELLENLTGNRFAVVNGDNEYTLKMSELTNSITVGFNDKCACKIINLNSTISGTSFEVEHEGEHYSFFTRLMGAHNAINIALCIPVAEYLGVSKSDIIGAVYDLKPVPHRLELIKGNRNITILDDTYNSNPDGAQAALSVLKSISGRKVVVTPGLVEMGEKSKEENNKLGQAIASAADVVILIRSRESEYIKEGLKEYNGIILYYDSLREATIEFSKTLSSGDVLLLLNDLPDNLGG